jgi:uncharacterized protein YbjT (DUF2867 family)
MALPDGIPLEMVAVRDIGRAAAAILLDGGAGVEGESLEIAGLRSRAGRSRRGSECMRGFLYGTRHSP